MQTFCTITTSAYLPYTKVLFASLRKFNPEITLQVLVTDKEGHESSGNFIIQPLQELEDTPSFKKIAQKYAHTNPHEFRWALKPVFITYLLSSYEKVIYVDADIFFISDYDFLFTHLDHSGVLLTPHWSDTNPAVMEDSLIHLMRNGLFNAGFVGANRDGLPAMQWWAEACHFSMARQEELGIFSDQKHLDILPVEFPVTEILQHRGCNLACWNTTSNKRALVNGKLLINGKYEGVFIHFTPDTIKHILNGNDYQLAGYLEEYRAIFRSTGSDLQDFLRDMDLDKKNNVFKKVKRRLLIRTRFKRWLYRLSQKI